MTTFEEVVGLSEIYLVAEEAEKTGLIKSFQITPGNGCEFFHDEGLFRYRSFTEAQQALRSLIALHKSSQEIPLVRIEVKDEVLRAIATELKAGLECKVPYGLDRLEMAEAAIAVQRQHLQKALELLQQGVFGS